MSWPLRCSHVEALLTEYEEGCLPWHLAVQVRMHLRLCPACAALRADLQRLPVWAPRREEPSPALAAAATAALKGALGRLGQPRPRHPHPVPEELRPLLAGGAHRLLDLMARVHRALQEGGPLEAPYLPADVASALPPPERWDWRRSRGARTALLALDAASGARLSLLVAPRGFRTPHHMHQGTESILVLDGLLEDGERLLDTGTWIHHGEGSAHAPTVLGGPCWCLIREVGTARRQRFFRRLGSPAA